MNNINNNEKYLPLGSIVILNGGIYKLVIVSRGVAIPLDNEKQFFEYGACFYPHGLINDKIVYFNREDIQKGVFEGFHDEDDDLMMNNIDRWYKKSGIKKGSLVRQRKGTE